MPERMSRRAGERVMTGSRGLSPPPLAGREPAPDLIRGRREAPGEGALPQTQSMWRGPLTRLSSLRSKVDLSPQAGRGKRPVGLEKRLNTGLGAAQDQRVDVVRTLVGVD